MRSYQHPSRQRDGSSGSSDSQYHAQEKDGCVLGFGFSGSRGSQQSQQSQHDGRGSRKEEDNRASLSSIEEFQSSLEGQRRARGRHHDIRQGNFGPSDDERYVFRFVKRYTNVRMWGVVRLVPIDPVMGQPFDEERTIQYFAWQRRK